MSDITVTLTQQEADYITQALGYHFQKSRLSRDTAWKYGLVVGKLATAKPADNHAQEAPVVGVRPSRGAKPTPSPASQQRCHAGKDGDCIWEGCPQLRDGEPKATNRHCPLDNPAMEKWDTTLELREVLEGELAVLGGFQKGDEVVILDSGQAGTVTQVYTNALFVEWGSDEGALVVPAEIELAEFVEGAEQGGE